MTSPNQESEHPLNKCLAGQTVLITRTADQSKEMANVLQSYGASVISHPVVEILPLVDFTELDRRIDELESFQAIVFVSVNGVKHFAARLAAPERLKSCKLIAIGNSTQNALQSIVGSAAQVLTPEDSNSESLADLILNSPNDRYLVVRANRGSKVLSNRLSDSNIEFQEVTTYVSRDIATANSKISAMIEEGKIDWITVTSSAIAKSAMNLFGNSILKLNSDRKCKLVSISPTTSNAIRECGFIEEAEATQFNANGIVEAILKSQINSSD